MPTVFTISTFVLTFKQFKFKKMKNYLLSMNSFYTTLSLMAALFFLNSCEPKEDFSPDLTKEFDLKSEINGANYHIRVALPANYNQSSEKYATVYVLDGPDIFEVVANRPLS